MNSSISKKQSKIFQYFLVIFFPIASYNFYKYVGININLSKGIYFITLLLSFLLVISELFKKFRTYRYANLMRLLVFFMFFSIFISYAFWNQDIVMGYRSIAPHLAIIYFFILLKLRIPIKSLEKIIWIMTIIYILLWTYAIIKAPELVFGLDSEADSITNDRGFFRLSIPGADIIILSFFLAINKFNDTKKKFWIFIFGGLFLIIILHVIRQIIIISFLIGLYFLLKKNKYLWIGLAFGGILLLGISNIKVNDNSIFGKLLNLSKDQIDENNTGEKDVRIQAYQFFFTEYTKNPINVIIGNGVPHMDSKLGKIEYNIAQRDSLWSSDVGFASIYIKYGIIGLLLYFSILKKVMFQKLQPQYMYARLFIIFVFGTTIAAEYIFTDVIIFALAIYILEYSNQEKNQIKRINI